MPTLEENVNRVKAAKTAIGAAITAKGGTVGANDGLEDFAADIASIPSGGGEHKILSNIRCKATIKNEYSKLSTELKTWYGLTNFNGDRIWTDGTNIYYSSLTDHYVLDKSTSTWSTKTWNGLSNFHGFRIWSDGENIYFSEYISGYSDKQYILDKSTSTWSPKTWYGLTGFDGENIWTDGTDIYYSSGSTQYVLDKATSTWSTKTWNGLNSFYGRYVWTDGTNIYYSSSSTQYYFNTAENKWISKIWNGGSAIQFNGNSVFSDGKYIFMLYSTSSDVCILNGNYWYPVGFSLVSQDSGRYVWTDGTNIYCSSGNIQLKISKKDIDTAPNTTPGLA